MASGFLKKLLKGVTAATIGGPAGAMALAVKKGIQKRKEKKAAKSIDKMQDKTAQLVSGDAKFYHTELKKRKSKIRETFQKIKAARILINKGATEKAAINAVKLTETELNEPTKYYTQ